MGPVENKVRPGHTPLNLGMREAGKTSGSLCVGVNTNGIVPLRQTET